MTRLAISRSFRLYRAWRKIDISCWECIRQSVIECFRMWRIQWQWWRLTRWAEKHPKEARERLKSLVDFLQAKD